MGEAAQENALKKRPKIRDCNALDNFLIIKYLKKPFVYPYSTPHHTLLYEAYTKASMK